MYNNSIFSKIIRGDLPSYKVLEDENNFSFLDINPLAYGHTLVVPKKEIDYIFDLSSKEYLDLLSFSRKIAIAMKKVLPCDRIGVSVIGLEVPHAHIHLVPINSISDLNFEKDKLKFTEEEMFSIANKISSSI
tara:strand:+ start:8750 stop:9148 length:399 start_codon:yes stop_codon:yes gene_type:complete